jgi:hypothetical protein
MLILAVLALVAAGVIGLYWHFIVPGAIIVLVGSLFINFTPVTTETAEENVKQEEVLSEHDAYIKDCMDVAEYSKTQCERLWLGQHEDTDTDPDKMSENHIDTSSVSKVKLLDVDNEEYKVLRTSALKKPNAVVFHETVR